MSGYYGNESLKKNEQNRKMGSFRKSRFQDKRGFYETSGTLQSPKVVQTEEEKAASRTKVRQEMKVERKKMGLKLFITLLLSILIVWFILKGLQWLNNQPNWY